MIPKVLKNNVAVFLILVFIAYVIVFLHFQLHPERIWGWDTSLYYLDEKITFGAYFSIVIHFLAGFLLLYTLKLKNRILPFLSQIAVGGFLMLLSFDEYFELHEYYREVVVEHVDLGGWYNSLMQTSWIFAFSVVIIAVFALMIIFVLQQTSRWVTIPLIFAIGMYAVILVLELKGGIVYGDDMYLRYVGWEEGLEMLSAALFLFAILNKNTLENTFFKKQ